MKKLRQFNIARNMMCAKGHLSCVLDNILEKPIFQVTYLVKSNQIWLNYVEIIRMKIKIP